MNPLKHPAAHQIPENDLEKRGEFKDPSVNNILSGSDSADNTLENSQVSSHPDTAPTSVLLRGRLARWNAKVESFAGLGTYLWSPSLLFGARSQALRSASGVLLSRHVPKFSMSPSQVILTSKP